MLGTADWPCLFGQGAIMIRSPNSRSNPPPYIPFHCAYVLSRSIFELEKMRTLGIGVLALGLMMASASAVFIWSGRTCSIGTGFCHHPLLLFVPVLATLAWGLMLKLNE